MNRRCRVMAARSSILFIIQCSSFIVHRSSFIVHRSSFRLWLEAFHRTSSSSTPKPSCTRASARQARSAHRAGEELSPAGRDFRDVAGDAGAGQRSGARDTLRRLRTETGRWEKTSILFPDSWFRINLIDLPSFNERAADAPEVVRWSLKRTIPIPRRIARVVCRAVAQRQHREAARRERDGEDAGEDRAGLQRRRHRAGVDRAAGTQHLERDLGARERRRRRDGSPLPLRPRFRVHDRGVSRRGANLHPLPQSLRGALTAAGDSPLGELSARCAAHRNVRNLLRGRQRRRRSGGGALVRVLVAGEDGRPQRLRRGRAVLSLRLRRRAHACTGVFTG